VARRLAGATLVVLVVSAARVLAAPADAPPTASAELDFLRRECVAAAKEVQQRERATLALEHDIRLLGRDADGRQRGLDESRAEQTHLLGTLLYLARHPPDRPTHAPAGAIERVRGELLLKEVLPALRDEARALSSEIERVAALRQDIATRQGELVSAREALAKDREHLAALTAHRLELTGRILPEETGGNARIAALGREASDIGELIKRSEAAAERRDKELVARARAALPKALKAMAGSVTAATADPTRPRGLRAFDPPHSALQMPVIGTIARRFGDADAAGTAAGPPSQGLSLAAIPGAEAVAPFAGRVIYAGPFGNFGLVLIIRHGALYHSLLAGLGRVDTKADQWVLAGEPVGAMDKAAGGTLYFELRRDGRPVDPQPWLAAVGQGGDPGGDGVPNESIGDKKVRE
jgi:septal ring factor EnvC (AmiA/AmiB activator)